MLELTTKLMNMFNYFITIHFFLKKKKNSLQYILFIIINIIIPIIILIQYTKHAPSVSGFCSVKLEFSSIEWLHWSGIHLRILQLC